MIDNQLLSNAFIVSIEAAKASPLLRGMQKNLDFLLRMNGTLAQLPRPWPSLASA